MVLPLYSCTLDGKTEVVSPLSLELEGILIMAVLCLAPLTAFLKRRSIWPALVGALACMAGLYYISYSSAVWATKLLVGWYTYTVSAALYVAASFLEIRQQAVNKSRRHHR